LSRVQNEDLPMNAIVEQAALLREQKLAELSAISCSNLARCKLA
jgi:hypothetical protein